MQDRDAAPATETLVRRTLEGDLAPFGALYVRLAPALYTWADLRIPRHARGLFEPEELVQEVWFRALDRIRTFDASRSFRFWVFKIASNTLLEGLRRVARGVGRGGGETGEPADPGDVPAEVTTVSRRAARNEAVRAFMEEVRTWPEEDRKLLLFRGLEGCSHDEVGARLEIGAAAAAKRWQRLRDTLARHPLPEELLSDG